MAVGVQQDEVGLVIMVVVAVRMVRERGACPLP